MPDSFNIPSQMAGADAVQLAVELIDSDRLREAEPILAAVLAVDPRSPDALHFMGILRCRQGRVDESVTLIRSAIAVAPTYAEAWHNLGNIFRAIGRPKDAEVAFRRTLELAPDILEAHLSLADLLRRAGRRAEAVPHYLRALQLQPDLAEAHFKIGKIYYRLGNTAAADATFRNWLRLDPENPVARHMVAAIGSEAPPERASDGYVRCEFDDFADTFDDVMATLGYSAPQLIAEALAVAVAPASQFDVLDCGCGTGQVGVLVRPWSRRTTGVDLSPAMIDRASSRGAYQDLVLAELTAYVETSGSTFDLVVSADTFIYFGRLDRVFRGVAGVLRRGGLFVFSVEHLQDDGQGDGFRLHPHGRYSHTETYVRSCLEAAGLYVLRITEHTIRLELKEPVAGLIVTARKDGDANG